MYITLSRLASVFSRSVYHCPFLKIVRRRSSVYRFSGTPHRKVQLEAIHEIESKPSLPFLFPSPIHTPTGVCTCQWKSHPRTARRHGESADRMMLDSQSIICMCYDRYRFFFSSSLSHLSNELPPHLTDYLSVCLFCLYVMNDRAGLRQAGRFFPIASSRCGAPRYR